MNARLAAIRLIGFDVDGVFTDGRFYLSDDGIESKAFNTQDGYGIRTLLQHGVHVAVISGRRSQAVQRRMQELGVKHVVLGCKDKVSSFRELAAELGVDELGTAFVGDDIPDLPLLRLVGLSFAVQNAVRAVKDEADIITQRPGGFGAVREVCDMLLGSRDGGRD